MSMEWRGGNHIVPVDFQDKPEPAEPEWLPCKGCDLCERCEGYGCAMCDGSGVNQLCQGCLDDLRETTAEG
jgi:hypothetical protein